MKCYGIVLPHLSPIQKGIQFAHAVAELMRVQTPEVKQWVEKEKTVILLEDHYYCKRQVIKEFERDLLSMHKQIGGTYAVFREPDLNNIITAVAWVPGENTNLDVYDKMKRLRLAQ